MEESLFTPFKGIVFLLAIALLLYPGVLLLQLLTGTVTESIEQIVFLLSVSLLVWLWAIRLYRNVEFPRVKLTYSE